jgi:L-alanine-DL-glutamate epimerase-like enolase superfamily enzyme
MKKESSGKPSKTRWLPCFINHSKLHMTQILSGQVRNPAKITKGSISIYRIPTDMHESDGTLEWDHTNMILVELQSGNERGLGYTYAHESTATVIKQLLMDQIDGQDAMQIEYLYQKMMRSIRNNGNTGIVFMAISAIDIALWDLKSRILGVPLATLLGRVKDHFPVYGSGGFTSYSLDQLKQQMTNWKEKGFRRVKMKVGRHPDEDVGRVRAVKEVIGPHVDLFVDANGAYTIKQAIKKAVEFSEFGVEWFEEPVSSDNLKGLYMVRHEVPPGMNIAAGEYGYHLSYFRKMLTAESVDVIQADATRCGGITGFIKVGHLSEAYDIPFSSHCAPAIHMQVAMTLNNFLIGEYFHDHVRIERELFDGMPEPVDGALFPDLTQPGLGLEFRYSSAEKYLVNNM